MALTIQRRRFVSLSAGFSFSGSSSCSSSGSMAKPGFISGATRHLKEVFSMLLLPLLLASYRSSARTMNVAEGMPLRGFFFFLFHFPLSII